MSGRLADQMDQLRRQRLEIEKSMRRIGDAFASGLDRQALLAILVETAVGACEADYGLVALSGHVGVGGRGREADRTGPGGGAGRRAAAALREQSGRSRSREGGAYAFASSLGPDRRDRRAGGRDDDRPGGQAVHRDRSARSSSISSARPPRRSRTSPCTSSSPSRRSPTTSPGSPTSAPSATVMEKEAARAARFRPRALAADARHRRLQAGQRHLRPSGRATRCCGPIGRILRPSRAGSTSRRATGARSSSWRCPRRARRARSSSRSGSAHGSAPSASGLLDGDGDDRGDGEHRRVDAAGVGDRRARADRGRGRGAVRGEARAARTGSWSPRRAQEPAAASQNGPPTDPRRDRQPARRK